MPRKKHKAPPFVMVRIDLLKDPEWRKLRDSSKIIYIYMRSKFNTQTLSKITLTYSELEDMYTHPTISRAFKQLVDKGFIAKVEPGGLFGRATIFEFIGPYKDYFYKGFKV